MLNCQYDKISPVLEFLQLPTINNVYLSILVYKYQIRIIFISWLTFFN